ncbi:MAG: ATP-binding protein [Thaumarchaeota archaeon]|nr:ATP-binding protein [Nitrososphaerota archaeon]
MKIPSNVKDWNYKLVLELVNKGFYETDWFDFKENLPQKLEHTACSFANTNGGFLIFGIKDDKSLEPSERIVGLDPSIDFPRLFGDKIEHADPHVKYEFRNPPISIPNVNKVIHIIHVPASKNGPHMTSDYHFLYRTNKGNQMMTREQLKEAFLEKEIFVQKSAYFRHVLEYELSQFMEGLLVYLRLETSGERIFFDEKGREKAHEILGSFIKDKEKMYDRISKLELRNLIKIYQDYALLRRGIEDAKHFPHSDFFPYEQDAFLILSERMSEVPDHSIINIEIFLKETLQIPINDFDTNFQKIIKENKELITLPRNLKSYVFDIQILTRATINMDRILLKIRRKFGDIAFKNTYDDVV